MYVVEQKVPFLMGGGFLRLADAMIDMKKPAILLKDGREVLMMTLHSGHLAIVWDGKIHRSAEPTRVLLSERVSRKEYNTPEVWEAMKLD